MMKETLNEESEKQARKESRVQGVFEQTIWVVSPKPSTRPAVAAVQQKPAEEPRIKFVEAERFIDARSFACRLFGVPEVVISAHTVKQRKPLPRWQVRFAGHAAGSNTLRMQSREILREGDDPEWVDTREM